MFFDAQLFDFEHKGELRILLDPKSPETGRKPSLFATYERWDRAGNVRSTPIPPYLHVFDYIISFMWQSCNSERAGSDINHVHRAAQESVKLACI